MYYSNVFTTFAEPKQIPLLSKITTEWMEWMLHRKGRETKQQPSMLPGPAVSGCCLVSFRFLCDIHSVYQFGGMRMSPPPPRMKLQAGRMWPEWVLLCQTKVLQFIFHPRGCHYCTLKSITP